MVDLVTADDAALVTARCGFHPGGGSITFVPALSKAVEAALLADKRTGTVVLIFSASDSQVSPDCTCARGGDDE